MSDKIQEVKKDIAELERLLSQTTRQKIKDLLSIEIRRLVSEVVKLEESMKNTSDTGMEVQKIVSLGNKCYDVKVNNYAWDQTQKYLKLYVTIPKAQTVSLDQVVCNFTNKSVELQVKGLDNKNYVFVVKNLLHDINPEHSSFKLKTDIVLLMAAKVVEENWSHVTELEKKASESKKLVPEKFDDSSDPSEGLMKMMKNLYETGDDEMKRVIAKAWTEGQQNRQMQM